MEALLEQEKKEASGPVSIWKRAQQEHEAGGNFLASTSPPRGSSSLLFDPTQRSYPHYNRWQRAPPPPSLAQPVGQPQLLLPASSKAGPAPADLVDLKRHVEQARETLKTELAEASKVLKAEASGASKELKAEAEAALESQRQQLDMQIQEVQRLIDVARETGHEMRNDLRQEHVKAKSSLKKVLDRGLSVANDAFRSKLTDIKNELLKDVLPFTEKYCGKWLTMFRDHEKGRKEVAADPARQKGRSSASAHASAVVHPTPCDGKRDRKVSCTPCTAVAANVRSHSPNAGGAPSKPPAQSEGATSTPNSCQTASVKVKSRKHPSSSPKTVSSRSPTPLPKAAPSKGSTPGNKTAANRPGSTSESRDQPNRPVQAKTAAKHRPTLTTLELKSSTTKSSPVDQPPANTPKHPSHHSGPVKRPRTVVDAEAALPPRKKRATHRRFRGVLRFVPSDDDSAAFK
jgi:hypothetical protein